MKRSCTWCALVFLAGCAEEISKDDDAATTQMATGGESSAEETGEEATTGNSVEENGGSGSSSEETSSGAETSTSGGTTGADIDCSTLSEEMCSELPASECVWIETWIIDPGGCAIEPGEGFCNDVFEGEDTCGGGIPQLCEGLDGDWGYRELEDGRVETAFTEDPNCDPLVGFSSCDESPVEACECVCDVPLEPA